VSTPPRSASEPALDGDLVLLSVPADGAYLGVLRTAAAGLAARLRFTLDEIEDLRIAVDEACAMLIGLASPASLLECRFVVSGEDLEVTLTVPAGPDGALPATSSLTWQMLTALTSAARATVADQTATIALTARRTPTSAQPG